MKTNQYTPALAFSEIESASNSIAWHLKVCQENSAAPDPLIIRTENRRIKSAHDWLDNFCTIKTEEIETLCGTASGEMINPPADLPEIIAVFSGVLVWSRKSKNRHQVRYGLEVHILNSDMEAALEFGRCLRHLVECEGLI